LYLWIQGFFINDSRHQGTVDAKVYERLSERMRNRYDLFGAYAWRDCAAVLARRDLDNLMRQGWST
jgi:hypothetical protein